MSYNPINWQNEKIGGTKVNATNLNIMDKGIADAHNMLADHDKKINDFANQQIPEEYVKGSVDNYISENQANLATKKNLEELDSKLSSEIVELKGDISEVDSRLSDELKSIENEVILDKNVLYFTENDKYTVKAQASNDILINDGSGWSYAIGNITGGKDYSINQGYFENDFSFFADANNKFISYIKDVKKGNYIYTAPLNATKIYICSNRSMDIMVVRQTSISILGEQIAKYPYNKVVSVNIPLLSTNRYKVVVGGTDGDYVYFTQGLNKAMELGNCDLIVRSGVYNLFTELTALGIAYESGVANLGGLKIGNNVRIFFDTDAKLIANYAGNSSYTKANWSPFMCDATDFEIHDMNLECSNVRYCVHDECQGVGAYNHRYMNCNMKLDNSSNSDWASKACIGGGFGEYGQVEIIGGKYESVNLDISVRSNSGIITYHNPISGKGTTFKNRLIVRDVYCDNGTIFMSCLGDSTKISEFIISGCSLETEPFANGKGVSSIVQNVDMWAWNNNIRN